MYHQYLTFNRLFLMFGAQDSQILIKHFSILKGEATHLPTLVFHPAR